MADDMSSASPEVNVLDQLAGSVRASLQASRNDRCNALHHELDAGDALIEAQKRVSSGWKRWVRSNCFLSVRTAMLYQQLARHREEIEVEIERIGELSLRAAIRLVAKPNPTKSPKTKRVLSPASWLAASPEERTQFLSEIGLPAILGAMPTSWAKIIEARVRGVAKASSGDSDARLSKIIRTALSHLAIADSPNTGKPAALGQEHAALAALRALNTALHAIDRDLHDVEIVLATAKSERTSKRRRAA
jgi:hypothetical protein